MGNIKCSFQDDNNLYLVLDLLEGGNLRFLQYEIKKFTEEQISKQNYIDYFF